MKTLSCLLLVVVLSSAAFAQTANLPAAITTDPPMNKANPAAMEELAFTSHGANLNGLVYLAEGAGPHPTVILLHGFPGYEQNLDLAQAIRRAGWNVLFFHYRGSWGSQGAFSFGNSLEDTQAAIAWVRDPQNTKKYRMDPNRVVLVGHSMGGFMASAAGAQDPKILGVVMIAAWNIGRSAKEMNPQMARGFFGSEIKPLSGCTVDGLYADMTAHKNDWDYDTFVPQLKTRPVLVVSANDDLRAANEAFVTAMKSAGAKRLTAVHFPTDHGFNDHRIALQVAVLDWLKALRP